MKSLKIFCLILGLIYAYNVNGLTLQLGDVTKSAVDTGIGIVTKVPDAIPRPDDLFQLSKNVIAGYPFDVAFKAINTMCSASLSQNTVKPRITPNISAMNFILKLQNEDISIPFIQPELLWSNGKFNRDWPLVIFATGWNTNYNNTKNSALDILYEAYRCRGNINFIAIDSAQFVDTLYTWSALNTDFIGELIAQALEILIRTYPIENIHLIGHSLGAHIVGSAGRNLYFKTEQLLPRITGLDPANPCFNEGESLSGLSRGDAVFVDIIHSNSGGLGKRDSLGDADYYPNGLHPLPPGCLTIVCAHMRAYELYAESVYPGNEDSFLSVKCTSLTAMNMKLCPGKKYPMGFAAQKNVKGNFFLKTNGASPFGLNNREGKRFLCNAA